MTYLPVATAVLGAILGGTLAYWLQRARPVVVVSSLRLTVENSDDQSNAKVNRALLQELDQYDRILDLDDVIFKDSSTEREYVLALSQAELDLRDEIETYLPRVREAAEELQNHLVNGNVESAEQSFARNVLFIWRPLAVASNIRRAEIFPARSPDAAEGDQAAARTRYYEVAFEDGDFVIDIPGVRSPALSTNFTSATKPMLERLAKRVADAVAYRNHADLLAVARALQAIADDRTSRANALLNHVRQELKPYSRFVVEGVVANVGRTAFSVTNRCKLVASEGSEILLRLSGPPASSQPSVYIDWDARAIDRPPIRKALDFSSPILVSPGQSQRFVCVSTETEQSFSKELLEAFEEGSRKFYLALGSIGNRRRQFKAIYSRDVPFRDLVHTAELPRRPAWKFRYR